MRLLISASSNILDTCISHYSYCTLPLISIEELLDKLRSQNPILDGNTLRIMRSYTVTKQSKPIIVTDCASFPRIMAEEMPKLTKKHDRYIIILLSEIVSNFELGSRNKRSDRLIQFCLKLDLKIRNTFFNFHLASYINGNRNSNPVKMSSEIK
uniref:Uncharacterized protein n=1 Tax=Glossina palpalis gambiensis TaxID=67801 RepID=A0A1B0C2I8_9MUSC